ncbi:MAG: DUF6979 family protein [Prosthecobacter sp.]
MRRLAPQPAICKSWTTQAEETRYGNMAVKAVEACRNNGGADPVVAWDDAARSVSDKESVQKKGCPKSAFLGLCEEGLVNGVPRGNYIKSKRGGSNKAYALEAVRILLEDGKLADQRAVLWQKVMSCTVPCCVSSRLRVTFRPELVPPRRMDAMSHEISRSVTNFKRSGISDHEAVSLLRKIRHCKAGAGGMFPQKSVKPLAGRRTNRLQKTPQFHRLLWQPVL